jgi:hypothetical protein
MEILTLSLSQRTKAHIAVTPKRIDSEALQVSSLCDLYTSQLQVQD